MRVQNAEEIGDIVFSVIIPARNEEEYIEACIRSVLAQTFTRVEIIVVDNGSTDMTSAIAERLGARVIHETCVGLPSAREAGRVAARGQFLFYLDADTMIPPGCLAEYYQHFQEQPDAVAISTPFRFFDGNWLVNATIAIHFFIYLCMHVLNITRFLFGGSFAVRRENLANIGGFDTSITFYGEDTNLSKRMRTEGEILFLPHLRGLTSARRYHRQGLVRTLLIYFLNYTSMLFLNRPYLPPTVQRRPATRFAFASVLMLTLLMYAMAYPKSALFGRMMYRINSEGHQKVVALTFDDGPNPVYTRQIMAVLDRERVTGTFFLIGKNVEAYPEVAAEIVHRGYHIGNHSYSHAWKIPFESTNAVASEVNRAEQAIYRATGIRPLLFRPPHGWRTPWMISTVRQRGYRIVTWADMTTDYIPTERGELIAKRLLANVHPNSIIVLHDGYNLDAHTDRSNAVEALQIVITQLKAQGYTFVSMDGISEDEVSPTARVTSVKQLFTHDGH